MQELREIMAELGFRTINEMVGQVDYLEMRENIIHWKYNKLDLSPVLIQRTCITVIRAYIKQEEQDHELESVLDWKLLEAAKASYRK